MQMKIQELESSLLLFLAAFIWGVAFVAQSIGLSYVGPMTFNGTRFLLGGVVLLPLIYYRRKRRQTDIDSNPKETRRQRKDLLTGGLCCGLAICIASSFQQYGIGYTTVGKAGFITALYIVIVPVLGTFLGKKPGSLVWAGALLATVGFYLLCIMESFQINRGDILVFICAICFSFHIMIIDYFAPKVDGVELSCLQFFISGILCMAGAFLWENPSWSQIAAGAVPILYAGIFSCGIAYTLQIIGQAKINPTVASMVLSLEAVISVLAGWIILKEELTVRQISGCVLVFGAVILAQLPQPLLKKKEQQE